jgi:hypothetical protein
MSSSSEKLIAGVILERAHGERRVAVGPSDVRFARHRLAGPVTAKRARSLLNGPRQLSSAHPWRRTNDARRRASTSCEGVSQ